MTDASPKAPRPADLWTALRSVLFNVVFYLNLVVFMIAGLPAFALPRRAAMPLLKAWARVSGWWLKLLAGTAVEVRGRGRLPGGPILVAAKHQSLWETFALLTVFDDPAVVLKRELTWIPVFGWYARKFGMIPVDRDAGPRALKRMMAAAQEALDDGRQVVIFPEGTRRAPGAAPAYKPGAAALYLRLGVPCVPVALNSGLFWPRRRFMRYPGTIVLEILDPIAPDLGRRRFSAELEERIETATARLLTEAEGS